MAGEMSVNTRSLDCWAAIWERTILAAVGWEEGVKHFGLWWLGDEGGFMTPALCQAISSIVLPRTPTWSIPNEVMPVTAGEGMMLVLS